MIIWGIADAAVNLGRAETNKCLTCQQTRSFSLLLQYEYFHVFWLFGLVTKKKYFLACDACQRGWELDKKKVEARLTGSAIPFMRRFGLLLLPVLFVLVFETYRLYVFGRL